MKKLLATLLAVLMLCGGMAVGASAATSSDTVLVLDYSGSMWGDPLTALKEAASIFVEGVFSGPGSNRVAVVVYGSGVQFLDFSSSISDVRAFINDTDDDGSTNMTGGLKKADELIKQSSAAVKNVLLMTDGMPNEGEYVETGRYTYEDYYNYEYANAAYNAAVDLRKNCNLYTLGFFHSLYGDDLIFARRLLEDMQSDGYWEVTDPADLEVNFDDILGNMQDVTEEWWATIPAWIQWILRYFLFGWIWMR